MNQDACDYTARWWPVRCDEHDYTACKSAADRVERAAKLDDCPVWPAAWAKRWNGRAEGARERAVVPVEYARESCERAMGGVKRGAGAVRRPVRADVRAVAVVERAMEAAEQPKGVAE